MEVGPGKVSAGKVGLLQVEAFEAGTGKGATRAILATTGQSSRGLAAQAGAAEASRNARTRKRGVIALLEVGLRGDLRPPRTPETQYRSFHYHPSP